MIIPCGLKHVGILCVVIEYIYLQKNTVHFVGWVLWFGNVYEYCNSCITLLIHTAIAENTHKKILPYSHNEFDSVRDYKKSPFFFSPEEKSVKNFCLKFAWIW